MMLALVWLHLLAAVVWIGGMAFLSLVLVPMLKQEPFAAQRGLLIKTAAGRFRAVVWGAIAVLLLTGPVLMQQRGIAITNLSAWPPVLALKLGLVAVLLLSTLTHDLILGPLVGRLMQLPEEKRTGLDQALVRWSPWVARLSLLLALAVLFAAVSLART